MGTAARVLLVLLAVTTLGAASASQTFTGSIADDLCAATGHAAMRMGPTDTDCAVACAEEHDAPFVLVDGTRVYKLSDQKIARTFAGKKVKVVGTLDEKTTVIAVESITAE